MRAGATGLAVMIANHRPLTADLEPADAFS